MVRRAKISCEISIPLQTWETEEEREEMMVKAADEVWIRVVALAMCFKPCLLLTPGALQVARSTVVNNWFASRAVSQDSLLRFHFGV